MEGSCCYKDNDNSDNRNISGSDKDNISDEDNNSSIKVAQEQ